LKLFQEYILHLHDISLPPQGFYQTLANICIYV